MTDLADWLRQQIAADERIARDASGHTVIGGLGNWRPASNGDEWEVSVSEHGDEELLVALRPGLPRPPEVTAGYWGAIIGVNDEERGRDEASPVPALTHAARHDPARVLREVTAKRAILDTHQHVPAVQQNDEHGYAFGCQTCHADTHCGETMGLGWCDTLKALAEIFADRPGHKWALWTGLGQ